MESVYSFCHIIYLRNIQVEFISGIQILWNTLINDFPGKGGYSNN